MPPGSHFSSFAAVLSKKMQFTAHRDPLCMYAELPWFLESLPDRVQLAIARRELLPFTETAPPRPWAEPSAHAEFPLNVQFWISMLLPPSIWRAPPDTAEDLLPTLLFMKEEFLMTTGMALLNATPPPAAPEEPSILFPSNRQSSTTASEFSAKIPPPSPPAEELFKEHLERKSFEFTAWTPPPPLLAELP